LNTRRFLFRLPESLSRWLDQASAIGYTHFDVQHAKGQVR
jgi:hypothetical protein